MNYSTISIGSLIFVQSSPLQSKPFPEFLERNINQWLNLAPLLTVLPFLMSPPWSSPLPQLYCHLIYSLLCCSCYLSWSHFVFLSWYKRAAFSSDSLGKSYSIKSSCKSLQKLGLEWEKVKVQSFIEQRGGNCSQFHQYLFTHYYRRSDPPSF